MTDAESVGIVTGGAQGLGAAICHALLKQGCKICVADIQEVKGRCFVEELQETYGSENVIFSFCDVTKEDHYESAFDCTLKAFGKVNILINNAGIILESDPRRVLEVNLMGPIIGCQTAFKYMGTGNGGKGGIVINTSSIVGLTPSSIAPIYAATKHGLVGLTRSYGLPYHLEKNGITFAALCPGLIDTDFLKISKINANPDLALIQNKGMMSPEDAAKGVLKILEDRINGSVLLKTKKRGFQYIGYQEELNDFPII